MERLTTPDLRLLLEFLREAYSLRDLQSFRTYLGSGLPKVIPCEIVGYAEMRLDTAASEYRFWPPEVNCEARDRLWEQHMHEHPVLAHVLRTGGGQAFKISDFLTRRQFHDRGLYCEVYRPMGVEDNLCITHISRPLVIGLALHRGRRDFSERDRALLNVAWPHLFQAYQNAKAVTPMLQELAAVRSTLECLKQGVILLAADGRVRFATARARQWVAEYFCPRSADRLPEALRRWVKHQDSLLTETDDTPRARRPLVVDRDGKRLVVRLVSDPTQSLLLFEEERTALESQPLQAFGLTRREAEVLSWVAQGKTNAEIGIILGARPRTVEKHLGRIYQKLGVENRTAAAAMALQTARLTPAGDR